MNKLTTDPSTTLPSTSPPSTSSERRGFLACTKAYFGFGEPGLTWRQRKRIFLENERRSWARLFGSRRPEDACRPLAKSDDLDG